VKRLAKLPLDQKSTLGAKLAAGKFVAFVEILPPRGVDASKEIAGAKLCKENGIDCINVPDGPRASARLSAQVTCQLIQQQAGIEAVLHFCCRDRNILSMQSELLGAHTVGVRNLICITALCLESRGGRGIRGYAAGVRSRSAGSISEEDGTIQASFHRRHLAAD
jgi:homocysteine S-methyltransferase